MAELIRYVPVRMAEEDYQKLKRLQKEKKYNNFSAFIRDALLENNGLMSDDMKKQMYNIQWEINKFGVNVNQATKRINSGFGSREDIKTIVANQERIKMLLEKYLEMVETKYGNN